MVIASHSLNPSNGIIVVKLKRKVKFREHVRFDPVRPGIIESFLNYLKLNNQFTGTSKLLWKIY